MEILIYYLHQHAYYKIIRNYKKKTHPKLPGVVITEQYNVFISTYHRSLQLQCFHSNALHCFHHRAIFHCNTMSSYHRAMQCFYWNAMHCLHQKPIQYFYFHVMMKMRLEHFCRKSVPVEPCRAGRTILHWSEPCCAGRNKPRRLNHGAMVCPKNLGNIPENNPRPSTVTCLVGIHVGVHVCMSYRNPQHIYVANVCSCKIR